MSEQFSHRVVTLLSPQFTDFFLTRVHLWSSANMFLLICSVGECFRLELSGTHTEVQNSCCIFVRMDFWVAGSGFSDWWSPATKKGFATWVSFELLQAVVLPGSNGLGSVPMPVTVGKHLSLCLRFFRKASTHHHPLVMGYARCPGDLSEKWTTMRTITSTTSGLGKHGAALYLQYLGPPSNPAKPFT